MLRRLGFRGSLIGTLFLSLFGIFVPISLTVVELSRVKSILLETQEAALKVRLARDVSAHLHQGLFGFNALTLELPKAVRDLILKETTGEFGKFKNAFAAFRKNSEKVLPQEELDRLTSVFEQIEHSSSDLHELAETGFDPVAKAIHFVRLFEGTSTLRDLLVGVDRESRMARDNERQAALARLDSAKTLLLWLMLIGVFVTISGAWVVYRFALRERQALFELRQRDKALNDQNDRFQAALSNMSQGLCMFDPDQRLIISNMRYAELYGLPPDLVLPGTTLKEIVEHRIARGHYAGASPEDYLQERLTAVKKNQFSITLHEMKDGRVILIAHHPTPGGGWVATHEDVTERKRAEAKIEHMARHDILTDLPNRALFREKMEDAIGHLRRHNERLAVLFLDLDQFKTVNDTLGHPIGDLLLKAVAKRLLECVRDLDTVARLGGDEFAILQIGIESPANVSALAERIVNVISEPYDLDGHRLVIGTSIGISVAPVDGLDSDQLLRNADLALYRAKADGRGIYRFFETEMDARAQARRALELDLRDALQRNEFELYYQPFVDLRTNRVTGMEALLRWNHPTRGVVTPAHFVPLAEEIGLITPIGEWVVRQACRDARDWPGDLKVAINLSPVQFRNGNLPSVIVDALGSAELGPERLELEITESFFLQENDRTRDTLHQFRAMGISIALDDFGTGYSSLSYLRSFPFDKIKMDRSFTKDLGRADGKAIIRAVADLGATLGMTTIAEGVELGEQIALLQAEGFAEAQGYYFSHPLRAFEVAGFLRKWQARAAA